MAQQQRQQRKVLAPGLFVVNAGTQGQQGLNPPPTLHRAARRLQGSGQQLEQGRLAGAIATQQANARGRINLDIDIGDRPHGGAARLCADRSERQHSRGGTDKRTASGMPRHRIDQGHAAGVDQWFGYSQTANSLRWVE
jgi:hypothetical protein